MEMLKKPFIFGKHFWLNENFYFGQTSSLTDNVFVFDMFFS